MLLIYTTESHISISKKKNKAAHNAESAFYTTGVWWTHMTSESSEKRMYTLDATIGNMIM